MGLDWGRPYPCPNEADAAQGNIWESRWVLLLFSCMLVLMGYWGHAATRPVSNRRMAPGSSADAS